MWSTLCKVTALILLCSLSKGELPEDDFRIVNRQDLLASDSDIFEDNSSKSFSQLHFDVARDQVIVGARDTLYRLSLRGLRQLERANWTAPPNNAYSCQMKGQTEDDCHNYIKVLLPYGHKLFTCGTNAFSPMCSWREIESITTVTEWTTGVVKCPYSPRSNVTAIITANGEYYAGTPTDFTSSDTTLSRSRGAAVKGSETLRTAQYDLNWLNEPQFVGSFEDDKFVYFIFREIAVEYMNCGKIIYSRIARVCKNDSGGRLLMKENWSTFLKARIRCSVRGEIPFDYDEVQSVEYLPQEKILVATFSTPVNSIAGSAVCTFNMSDIHAAFDGPYKVQNSPTSVWEPRAPSSQAREHFQCGKNTSYQVVEDFHRYHLMYDAVEPIDGGPVFKATAQRFTHATVDVTNAKSGRQLVVYVATQSSEILKIAVLHHFDGACLVERWKLKDKYGGFDILNLQFVKETMSVYVGSETGVLRISGDRCWRYKTRSACVGATDPHCGWDESTETCVRATDRVDDPSFVQNTASCGDINMPVDGGWSSWSEWESCVQEGASTHTTYTDDKPDLCMCRRRKCSNPAPANGGLPCKGASIAVTNCTVHGGWSPWSGWSECSASCGIAVKSRRRTCTAPEPKFDGRVCVGIDAQDIICSNLPPCPDPSLAPIDGGWSSWSSWSACTSAGTSTCGPAAGWQERHRECNNPAPRNNGADCEGNKVDRQVCDMRPCEVRKANAWTPWVQIPGNASDGSYTEKRFKFACRAPSPEQIKLSLAREEERYCSSSGICSNSPPDEGPGWDAWGPWGPCSASCGGGQQRRERQCRRPPCTGSDDMLRACNTHACSGIWSCWSEWSECSGGCSGGAVTGHRTRSRMCLSAEGCADAGAALERKLCVSTCAESESGWDSWGEWSPCKDGEKIRRRSCRTGSCVGAQLQVALCKDDDDDMDNDLYAMPAYSPNVEMASFVKTKQGETLSVGGVVGLVITAFIIGCVLCLAGVIYCDRCGRRLPWRRTQKVPSSPHYMTAKQNSYVTVPLKDVPRKAKRQPSFSGIGASGVILSKSNNLSNANNHNLCSTPKLYPKAIANEYDSMGTLRRHSNQPNNKNNYDAEEDKFY